MRPRAARRAAALLTAAALIAAASAFTPKAPVAMAPQVDPTPAGDAGPAAAQTAGAHVSPACPAWAPRPHPVRNLR
jgi:hypothetical protein